MIHQMSTSLRMTEDGRPFSKDLKHIFSILILSLPLTPHRVRFHMIEHTFTSEEAIRNLSSLKFSQSYRTPDPNGRPRIITTTTTTTFSAEEDIAYHVCQSFVEARFIESVNGINDFSSKSAVWQLTGKGLCILQQFSQRNGISQNYVYRLLASPRNTRSLLRLERDPERDKVELDEMIIEVIFRRFAGSNADYTTCRTSTDALDKNFRGLIGTEKKTKERRPSKKGHHNKFTGKTVADWLMDYCSILGAGEAQDLAQLFCDYGFIERGDGSECKLFSPSKTAVYIISKKEKQSIGTVPGFEKGRDTSPSARSSGVSLRSSTTKTITSIIGDPALRLMFREFLRQQHCEENLAFCLDVREFLANHAASKGSPPIQKLEIVNEMLATAHSLYSVFLAPNSPCELNLDHSFRTSIVASMPYSKCEDDALVTRLDDVVACFERAYQSVMELMASDSVPKFLRDSIYASILHGRNLDVTLHPDEAKGCDS